MTLSHQFTVVYPVENRCYIDVVGIFLLLLFHNMLSFQDNSIFNIDSFKKCTINGQK
jgi:hypothetical protein